MIRCSSASPMGWGISIVLAATFVVATSSNAAADAMRDAERNMRDIERVLRIRTDLRKGDVRDALRTLDQQQRALDYFKRNVQKVHTGTAIRAIKRDRQRLMSTWSRTRDKWRKAKDKVKAAGRDQKKLRDVRSPMKDLHRQIKSLKRGLSDFKRTIEREVRNAEKAARQLVKDTKQVASTISRARGSKSDREVQNARRMADKIKRTAERGIIGSDRLSVTIRKTWPRMIDDFRKTALSLGRMKTSQAGLDRDIRWCISSKKSLQAHLGKFKRDPDVAKLKKFVAGLKKTADNILRKKKQLNGKMRRWMSDSGRFRGKGAWGTVAKVLSGTAKAVYGNFSKVVSTVDKRCKPLAQGEKNRAVAKAFRDLKRRQSGMLKRWSSESRRWIQKASTVFKWSCGEIKRVETALCGVESERNEKPNYSAAKAMAARMERGALNKIDALIKVFSRLSKTAKNLMQARSLKSKVERIYNVMLPIQGKLRGALRKDVLAGSRHPFTKFAVEYGKQRHSQMESGCTVADKPLPGGRVRPDCFRAKSCYILEFKPAGNTTWPAQLSTYQKGLTAYYTKKVQEMIAGRFRPESPWGTKAIVTAVKLNCSNSKGRVTLRTQPKFYKRCQVRYKCVK